VDRLLHTRYAREFMTGWMPRESTSWSEL